MRWFKRKPTCTCVWYETTRFTEYDLGRLVKRVNVYCPKCDKRKVFAFDEWERVYVEQRIKEAYDRDRNAISKRYPCHA